MNCLWNDGILIRLAQNVIVNTSISKLVTDIILMCDDHHSKFKCTTAFPSNHLFRDLFNPLFIIGGSERESKLSHNFRMTNFKIVKHERYYIDEDPGPASYPVVLKTERKYTFSRFPDIQYRSRTRITSRGLILWYKMKKRIRFPFFPTSNIDLVCSKFLMRPFCMAMEYAFWLLMHRLWPMHHLMHSKIIVFNCLHGLVVRPRC